MEWLIDKLPWIILFAILLIAVGFLLRNLTS